MIDLVVRTTWERIRERMKAEVTAKAFEMWLDKSSVMGLKRGTLSIGVPNLFIQEWVEENYSELLTRLASEELGTGVKVAIKIDPELFRQMQRATSAMEEAVEVTTEKTIIRSLDGFLELPGNEIAVRALRHVAEGKEPVLSPLVIHGGEGTGKSHLADAVSTLFPAGTTIYRATGEQFAKRFSRNLKSRRMDAFRSEIGEANAVVIDDAQDLAGKTVTQRELATLAEELRARSGQLVIFLNDHPEKVEGFEEQLVSHLVSGMLVELQPQSTEEKVAILEGVLSGAQQRIPREVLEIVVERVGGSVTQLNRVARKVYAYAGLSGMPVDATFLDRHLDEIVGPRDPAERRINLIFSLVEEHFDVEREDLLSKRKTKALSAPRGIIVLMLRQHVGLTFKEIGKALGDRSHTSVYLMHKKYEELLPGNPSWAALAKEVGRRILVAS